MTKRFTLEVGRWYACEFIGDEFEVGSSAHSPIRTDGLEPVRLQNRQFRLHFYHSNYPEGVRDKVYTLETIHRGQSYILAKSSEHDPTRFLLVCDIDAGWLDRHFPQMAIVGDIQEWLTKNC